MTVEGSREVSHMLRRLLDILLVKNQALSGGQRERAKNVMEYSSSDISSFWLLHTVNRNFAKLRHLSLASPLHPEELYLALAEFCGELQTFSTHYTLSDIPAYRHDDLHTVLPALDAQIRELLETVISSRYAIIPLHSPKPSFYIGRLESDRLLENVDYYLSVQSELPASQIIDSVPLKMKIGAPDDVEKSSTPPCAAWRSATRRKPRPPFRCGWATTISRWSRTAKSSAACCNRAASASTCRKRSPT